MNKKQRARRSKAIRHDQFSKGIAEGLTIGVPKEEALEMFPVRNSPTGAEVVQHMATADERLNTRGRVPFAQFVARNSTDAVWDDGVTDRPQMDYSLTYTDEGLRLLREGRQCLRCQEPHPDDPFPVACDMCGYSMKARQIMDIAMEFEGNRHLGPSRPISEHLAELELRTEKRKFIDRVMDGGGGKGKKIPKAWLHDAYLFPDGAPPELA
jgi:hypothetical protein